MDGYQRTVYTWRQLTELVAAALGRNVNYDGKMYRDDNGCRFDPVRSNADCFRLAIARKISIWPGDDVVIAEAIDAPGNGRVLEYHEFNDYDPLRATRSAVCRAVLLQHQLALAA